MARQKRRRKEKAGSKRAPLILFPLFYYIHGMFLYSASRQYVYPPPHGAGDTRKTRAAAAAGRRPEDA
jgi:hypothetical protein